MKNISSHGMVHPSDLGKLRKTDVIDLLLVAVEKIDHQNLRLDDNDYDERDWKDILCDHQFILGELFQELIERRGIGVVGG